MMMNAPWEERGRARAFEIYLERGRRPGHELDDWLQAEFELTHLPIRIARLKPIRKQRKLSSRQRAPMSVRFSKQ